MRLEPRIVFACAIVSVLAGAPVASAAGKAAGDSLYLLGGPGQLSGKFQDDLGQPDGQGWVGVDRTVPPGPFWHVDTFNAANLDPAEPLNHAWWCGDALASCGGADPEGGYGDGWHEWLEWFGSVPDTSLALSIRVTARLNHDTEPGYDVLTLEYETAAGMQVLAGFAGLGAGVALDDTCTLAPGDYGGPGGDQAHLRFRFVSDGADSDADCGYPTAGAAQIDSIAVFFDQGGGFAQVGSVETGEAGDPLQWAAGAAPGVGNFAKVWPLLDDADPAHQNDTPQFAFVDDGVVVPGTGGYAGQTWTYGPGGWIVNPEGGLAGPAFHLHDEIWSPPVAWPGALYDGALLAFDVYRHLPTGAGSPGMYYVWRVRSTDDPAGLVGWTEWRDRGEVYAGGAEYHRHEEALKDLLVPGRTHVQIALGVQEYGWQLGQTGTDGTPAPYFDNVALLAFDFTGYEIRPDGSGDFPSIQAALDSPAVADGDTLWLADGTFTGPGNRDIDFGGKRVVVISRSGDRAQCVIDCQGSAAGPHRAFWFHAGEDSAAAVVGITIRNGWVADHGGAVLVGGAGEPLVHRPLLRDCAFEGNHAAGRGGAVACGTVGNGSEYGDPHLEDCLFLDNSADEDGGGLYCHLGSSPRLLRCDFLGNEAENGGGAAFYWESQSELEGCRFEGNIAALCGGGAFVPWEQNNVFRDCVFVRNEAADGGAFCNPLGISKKDLAPPRPRLRYSDDFQDCVFTANSADRGGAVYAYLGCDYSFQACRFDSNSATVAGGAILDAAENFNEYADCVFVANVAAVGGAIAYDGGDPQYPSPGSRVVRCTFLGNRADRGSALDIAGLGQLTFTVESSILAGGGIGAAVHVDALGDPTVTCSDVYGNEGGDWVGALTGLEGTDGNFSANPLFCLPGDSLPTLAGNSPCLPGQHPDGAACDLVGALAAGCADLSFAPERVMLRARTTPHVHPGDSIAVALTIHDAAGARVPDEGVRPSLAAPAKALGSLSFLALKPDTAWVAFYRAGQDTGSEQLTALDPEAASAPADTLTVRVTDTAIIAGVTDVPNDQGRQVRVTWQRDLHDAAGASPPVTEYVVWRRVDDLKRADGRTVLAPAELGEVAAALERAADEQPLLRQEGALWEPVGPSVPAMLWTDYAAVVPTLADSTADGVAWSVFFISAHTPQPQTFYSSPPDSGWSVDNLAPHVPEGLLVAYGGLGNQLSWEESPDEDFQYFRVYRGEEPDFPADPAHLVHATTGTSWLDDGVTDPWGRFYKLTAVDFSGRESAVASPASVTGVDGRDTPARPGLHPNVPNPFNPRTTIAYDVGPREGMVRLRVFDVQGRLVRILVDARRTAGRHLAVWDGRDDRGIRVPSGVYFCRLQAPGIVSTIKMMLVQ